MKIFLSKLFLLCFCFSQAQVKIKTVDKAKIPAAIQYPGKLKNAVTWTDNSGTHYVITTETGIVASKGNPGNRDASVFAYHFLSKGDSIQLMWKVLDFVKDCPVDAKAHFVKNSLAVTDLNTNGQPEVWLVYQTACRGDVSPSEMKIVMYEGSRKFAARGTTRVKLSENEYEGGSYTLDDAFTAAPVVFKNYVKKMWQRNMAEIWE